MVTCHHPHMPINRTCLSIEHAYQSNMPINRTCLSIAPSFCINQPAGRENISLPTSIQYHSHPAFCRYNHHPIATQNQGGFRDLLSEMGEEMCPPDSVRCSFFDKKNCTRGCHWVSHLCPPAWSAAMRVTSGIPLGCSLSYRFALWMLSKQDTPLVTPLFIRTPNHRWLNCYRLHFMQRTPRRAIAGRVWPMEFLSG